MNEGYFGSPGHLPRQSKPDLPMCTTNGSKFIVWTLFTPRMPSFSKLDLYWWMMQFDLVQWP